MKGKELTRDIQEHTHFVLSGTSEIQLQHLILI
jgi:hypothetical protein